MGDDMDQRFPRRERIRLKREFDLLFRRGRAFRWPELTVRAMPNDRRCSRLGLSVGKRCGNAVRRNRIKRVLREAYRLNRQLLNVPCDLVIVPCAEWREVSLKAIEPLFRKALMEIGEAFTRR
jgi:ribonuclease P protein component